MYGWLIGSEFFRPRWRGVSQAEFLLVWGFGAMRFYFESALWCKSPEKTPTLQSTVIQYHSFNCIQSWAKAKWRKWRFCKQSIRCLLRILIGGCAGYETLKVFCWRLKQEEGLPLTDPEHWIITITFKSCDPLINDIVIESAYLPSFHIYM